MRMTEDDVSQHSIEDEDVWPSRRSRVLDWLVNGTRDERFIDNVLVALSERLVEAGVPVARTSLHFQTNHPQWRGARLMWKAGLAEAEIDLYGYEVAVTEAYMKSPLKIIQDGADQLRKDLAAPVVDPDAESSLYADLRA